MTSLDFNDNGDRLAIRDYMGDLGIFDVNNDKLSLHFKIEGMSSTHF